MNYKKDIKPEYSSRHYWESYASEIYIEYEQCMDEGLDVEAYKDFFDAMGKIPASEIKTKFGDILFEVVKNAEIREGYKYTEPSELGEIKKLRKEFGLSDNVDADTLESKIYGAWMGRVCGCMLGKTVEGIRTNELVPFLKETGNYPMHRYIYKTDINDEICEKYSFPFAQRCYADEIDGMPPDDDTNYVALGQVIIEKYGRDFTPNDVASAWLTYQRKDAYCTAERVAFCNFVNGYKPPMSAMYKNVYREWIGAQIRADYYGYINPGNPEMAAEMAWRDASISHVKNGIYGEMFVAAMLAAAAVTNNIEKIVLSGLGQIPHTSRLYEDIMQVLDWFKNGVSQNEAFDKIHEKYNEHSAHGWCHTISNAMVVVASLLYGAGDYGKSICMSVETGFDTDCNGATVGSIIGMANGIDGIPEYWREPIKDKLNTTIFGVGALKISEAAKNTMKHIK